MVEPTYHAQQKGLRKGQKYKVEYYGPGYNRNYPRETFYAVQPPKGKSTYAFYQSEIKLVSR